MQMEDNFMKNLKVKILLLIAVFSIVSCNGGGGGENSTTPVTNNNEPSTSENAPLTQVELTNLNKFMNQFESQKNMTKEELLFLIHKNLPSQKKATYQLLDQKIDIDCEDSCIIKKKEESNEIEVNE